LTGGTLNPKVNNLPVNLTDDNATGPYSITIFKQHIA